jgi:hypothetical protein
MPLKSHSLPYNWEAVRFKNKLEASPQLEGWNESILDLRLKISD